MNPNNEPMPPEARKALRLAIATHLTHALLRPIPSLMMLPDEEIVNRAYSLADLLIGKSGL